MRLARFLPLALVAALLAGCTESPRSLPPVDTAADLPSDAPIVAEEPAQIVVWSSRPLPERLHRRARTIPGVLAVGSNRAGIVDLRRAIGASKRLPSRPSNAILPISVTSLPPRLLRAVPRYAAAAPALAHGRAVLPRSTAKQRGLEPGDRIVLRGARTVRLRIGTIVEDDRSYRAEMLVPPDAARRLGLSRARALTLAVDAASTSTAEAALEDVIGRFPARIRTATDTEHPVSRGRLLTFGEIKDLFGEFWYVRGSGLSISIERAWRKRNIVKTQIPLLGTVKCHRLIIPQLRAAMNELILRGLAHHIDTFNGCYNPRMMVSNNAAVSRHSFGIAFDINAGSNGYGAKPTLNMRVVRVIDRWGFTWGGRWTVPDGMHFEFVRFK